MEDLGLPEYATPPPHVRKLEKLVSQLLNERAELANRYDTLVYSPKTTTKEGKTKVSPTGEKSIVFETKRCKRTVEYLDLLFQLNHSELRTCCEIMRIESEKQTKELLFLESASYFHLKLANTLTGVVEGANEITVLVRTVEEMFEILGERADKVACEIADALGERSEKFVWRLRACRKVGKFSKILSEKVKFLVETSTSPEVAAVVEHLRNKIKKSLWLARDKAVCLVVETHRTGLDIMDLYQMFKIFNEYEKLAKGIQATAVACNSSLRSFFKEDSRLLMRVFVPHGVSFDILNDLDEYQEIYPGAFKFIEILGYQKGKQDYENYSIYQ